MKKTVLKHHCLALRASFVFLSIFSLMCLPNLGEAQVIECGDDAEILINWKEGERYEYSYSNFTSFAGELTEDNYKFTLDVTGTTDSSFLATVRYDFSDREDLITRTLYDNLNIDFEVSHEGHLYITNTPSIDSVIVTRMASVVDLVDRDLYSPLLEIFARHFDEGARSILKSEIEMLTMFHQNRYPMNSKKASETTDESMGFEVPALFTEEFIQKGKKKNRRNRLVQRYDVDTVFLRHKFEEFQTQSIREQIGDPAAVVTTETDFDIRNYWSKYTDFDEESGSIVSYVYKKELTIMGEGFVREIKLILEPKS